MAVFAQSWRSLVSCRINQTHRPWPCRDVFWCAAFSWSAAGPSLLPMTGGGNRWCGHMAKTFLAIALAAALIRAFDNYFFFGKYTDTAMFVAGQIWRSLGI